MNRWNRVHRTRRREEDGKGRDERDNGLTGGPAHFDNCRPPMHRAQPRGQGGVRGWGEQAPTARVIHDPPPSHDATLLDTSKHSPCPARALAGASAQSDPPFTVALPHPDWRDRVPRGGASPLGHSHPPCLPTAGLAPSSPLLTPFLHEIVLTQTVAPNDVD
ncbi:hypothetical protein VTO42DRAFT_7424 [Malbranchea cinnamomea]